MTKREYYLPDPHKLSQDACCELIQNIQEILWLYYPEEELEPNMPWDSDTTVHIADALSDAGMALQKRVSSSVVQTCILCGTAGYLPIEGGEYHGYVCDCGRGTVHASDDEARARWNQIAKNRCAAAESARCLAQLRKEQDDKA